MADSRAPDAENPIGFLIIILVILRKSRQNRWNPTGFIRVPWCRFPGTPNDCLTTGFQRFAEAHNSERRILKILMVF